MKRREFIKETSLASIGILATPALFSGACKSYELPSNLDYNGKIVIIGAGAAGLYAGYLLQSKGIEYQILEASGKPGGRLGKVEGFADFPIDLGAQWLHCKNSIIGKLVKKNNTKITKDNSEINYWFENRIVDELPEDIAKIFEKNNLPDIPYEDYAKQEGFG